MSKLLGALGAICLLYLIPAAARADVAPCAADGLSCQWLFTLEADGSSFTDASGNTVNLVCQYFIEETAAGLAGLWCMCNDGTGGALPLAKVEAGVVLRKSGDHVVASLKASSDFSPIQGGPITLTYLSKGSLDSSYDQSADYGLVIRDMGSRWTLYTGPENGNRPLTYMFMKARRDFFGIVTGVESISIAYSPPAQ